ncbi:hypothetical protein MMC27_002248 [Xylographa pallens]|nr:hypothetical protein [Xylographa pallens]
MPEATAIMCAEMRDYVYRKLDSEKEEIRLMDLHPGRPDDPIAFTIYHVPLVPPSPSLEPVSSTRLRVVELQKTLSQDWDVKETVDGRYLFSYVGEHDIPNSWSHPVPGFERALYESSHGQGESLYEPVYEALSYTWGTVKGQRTANVTGEDGRLSQMRIGPNLDCALRYLRNSRQIRPLWVDAVCVNQDDIDERNAQVKRMANIYSLAQRVVVWLGEQSNDSKLGLETLQYLANQIELGADNSWGDAPGAEHPKWYSSSHRLPYNEGTWSAITKLFARDWFTRVWVLQEVQLAKHAIVQVGEDTIPWLVIRKCIIILGRKVDVPKELIALVFLHRNSVGARLTLSFSNLMYWASHHHCLDPRDKLYGLLSLVPPATSARIQPRYSDSPLRVFVDAFLAHLDSTKRLEMLRYCRYEQKVPYGPSWIPNWSIDLSKPGSRPTRNILGQPAGLSAAHTCLIGPGTLEVTGVRLACVSAVAKIASGDAAEAFQTIRQWQNDYVKGGTYVGGGSSLDAFLQTIFRGRFKDRWPASHLPTLSEVRTAYLDTVSGSPAQALLFNHLESEDIDGSALFSTAEGYFGLAFADAKTGDLVCALLGCDRLVLLRPAARGGWLVVGSSHVHGFMDGEGVLGPLPKPWKIHLVDIDHYLVPQYVNTGTNEAFLDDPRLPPLDPQWSMTTRQRTQDDPWLFRDFRNAETEIMPEHFLCHTMGGIVAEQALVKARNESGLYPGFDASVSSVLSLGTPHSGSPPATIRQYPLSNREHLGDRDSQYLA